jgi:phospholipid-binding lipoprotein MlaA
MDMEKFSILKAAALQAFISTAVGTVLLITPGMSLAQDETTAPETQDIDAEDIGDEEIYDPIEPVNRGIFWFNDKVDVYVLEPVAEAYEEVVPEDIQTGIGNFFTNLRYPQYLLSDLVQLKFEQSLVHTGRFVINSTVGLLGFIDVAKHIGLENDKEDFGLALAYHGVPPGPYIVLPFLGPSNLRDTVGTIVDGAVHPFAILGYTVDEDWVDPVVYGGRAIEVIHQRAGLLDAVEAAKSSSLDYYLFLQAAYYQHRRGLLYDGNPPEEDDPFADDIDPPADTSADAD